MALHPEAPATSAPVAASTGSQAPSQPSGDQLVQAVQAPGAERLRAQAQVYGHKNGIDLAAALSALPLEARLEIMKGQWEAAQTFFRSWAESIAQNGAADRQASKKALANAQEVAVQERNTDLTRRVISANAPRVEHRGDGLVPPGRVGVQRFG